MCERGDENSVWEREERVSGKRETNNDHFNTIIFGFLKITEPASSLPIHRKERDIQMVKCFSPLLQIRHTVCQ